MTKFTRRFKKNKRSRTYKKGGAVNKDLPSTEVTIPETNKPERNGIFDYLGEKVKDGASDVFTTVGDIGLRAVGLERVSKADEEIKEAEEDDKPSMVNEKLNELSDASSGVISDIKNVADKTGAAIIENVNEVLGSNVVKESTQQAAENTAEIVKEGAEVFNAALNSPEVKEELKEAIDNAAQVGTVAIKAAEQPINEAADVLAQTVPRAAASSVAGLIKVGTDAMAAVPYLGAAIEFGKMLNDGSKAVSGVVEATTDAVEAGSDLIIETKENFDKGMAMLEKTKKMAEEISNRTNESINDFESPLNKFKNTATQAAGGKTRKRFFRKRGKSKRVRFAI